MGIDATMEERATDNGDLCLTLNLRLPPTLDSDDGDEARERSENLEAEREQVVGWAANLEARIAELEDRGGVSETDSGRKSASVSHNDLTDGERETLRALQKLGGPRSSGDIADEVDATVQSVRSWLPKLVQAGHIQSMPDPSDGRRKLYSPVECDEPTDNESSEDGDGTVEEPTDDESSEDVDGTVEEDVYWDGTVYVSSNGRSPSQVFHIREDCPRLRNCADFTEKDRSVVPNHRPCSTCVSEDLDEGLVAVANESPTKTYHKQEDCSKLKPATEVEVQEREAVPDHDPCTDCGHRDGEENVGDKDDNSRVAQICTQNDIDPEEIIDALARATAIYHVQRDLRLSRDDTETLLQELGELETLFGGGQIPLDRAKSVVGEYVPSTI
jgi:DNA-binding MarR family transcriptional regulator